MLKQTLAVEFGSAEGLSTIRGNGIQTKLGVQTQLGTRTAVSLAKSRDSQTAPVGSPRGSKYPIFKAFGPKYH